MVEEVRCGDVPGINNKSIDLLSISDNIRSINENRVKDYQLQLEINSKHTNLEISQFSQAVIENQSTQEIVNFVGNNRPDLTSLHFGLLLYSSYKYAFYNQIDFEPGANWNQVITAVNNNQRVLFECLVEKSVNITSPYRYSAINLAISKQSGKKPVSVADIGCGFYPFGIGYKNGDCVPKTETDEKPADFLAIYSRIEAIDLQKPDPTWAAASQWEPLSQMPGTVKKYQRLLMESDKLVNFQVGDITRQSPNIEPVDYCFITNILYQISSNLRETTLKNISHILKREGVLLTADFLPNGSRKRPFTYAIQAHYQRNGKISLTEGKTIFLLENADCQKIRYQ